MALFRFDESISDRVVLSARNMEDIVFCVDVDREGDTDMRIGGSGKVTEGLTRLDVVKQAMMLFLHAKLAINPLHRFAVSTIGMSATWVRKELTSDADIIGSSIREIKSAGQFLRCDLASVLDLVASDAKASQDQGRCLRVILFYFRSSVVPEFPLHWPESQQVITLDALYVHDKPSVSNCPQKVYDVLVDALEDVSKYEGYIYESSSASARVILKNTCNLLSHAKQRCRQDELTTGRDISKGLQVTEDTTPFQRNEIERLSSITL